MSPNYLDKTILLRYTDELRYGAVVFNSQGIALARVKLEESVVFVGFMADEKLLVVHDNASFQLYNAYDKRLTPRNLEIPLKSHFDRSQEGKGIEFVKSCYDSFVVMAGNKTLHMIYDFDSPKRATLPYDREVDAISRHQLAINYDFKRF